MHIHILPVDCELLYTGEGVLWSNISQGVSVDDDFALLHVILMLLLDSLIYACIAWYIEAVYPGEYGIPRPPYFPLLVSSPFITWWEVALTCCISHFDYPGSKTPEPIARHKTWNE